MSPNLRVNILTNLRFIDTNNNDIITTKIMTFPMFTHPIFSNDFLNLIKDILYDAQLPI